MQITITPNESKILNELINIQTIKKYEYINFCDLYGNHSQKLVITFNNDKQLEIESGCRHDDPSFLVIN